MSDESKLPPEEGSPGKSQPLSEGTAETTPSHDTSAARKAGKLKRILCEFAGGVSLNTFQAKELGDTCLHTTVSDLQTRYGLRFERATEKISNRFGTTSRVMRYWLQGAELEKAQAIATGRQAPCNG